MAETAYEVELLNGNISKIFAGVYNDFKAKAVNEYKFELEPLPYEEFIDAVEKNYMQCIVLKENDIPTAVWKALADFYQVSVDYLMRRTDVREPYPSAAKK